MSWTSSIVLTDIVVNTEWIKNFKQAFSAATWYTIHNIKLIIFNVHHYGVELMSIYSKSMLTFAVGFNTKYISKIRDFIFECCERRLLSIQNHIEFSLFVEFTLQSVDLKSRGRKEKRKRADKSRNNWFDTNMLLMHADLVAVFIQFHLLTLFTVHIQAILSIRGLINVSCGASPNTAYKMNSILYGNLICINYAKIK